MRINNKTVYHIRLINGDELLSIVSKKTKNEYVLINPLVVDESVNPNTGQSNLLLAKYSLSTKEEMNIQNSHIVTFTEVHPEISSYYYKSLEYNKKHIEPKKLEEISRVNIVLDTVLGNTIQQDQGNVIIFKEVDKKRLVINSSNTIN